MAVNVIVGIVLILAFLGYDIYLATDKVDGNTWSELARRIGMVTPFLPWVWGVLAGHFWHPFRAYILFIPAGNVALLIWLTWVLVVAGMILKQYGWNIPMWAPLIPGFFAGWLLWPVR